MAIVNCILFRISENRIINFNYNINDEVLPPAGLDPDLKVYAKYEPFPQQEIDARLFKLQVINELNDTPHPNYPQLGQYKTTYTEIARTNEEKILDVKTREDQANLLVKNGCDLESMNSQAITALYKKVKKEDLEIWQQDLLNLSANYSAKIQNNKSNAELKISAIEAGQVIDLDTGWIES